MASSVSMETTLVGSEEDYDQSQNNNISIPDCTIRWTKDTLTSLHITSLSKVCEAMDIIYGVFKVTTEMDEAVETLKCCICKDMPDGLRNLDFTCVSEITREHEPRLTSENCSLFSCWKFKKRRKLNYYQRLLHASLDKMNPRFSSSGETFGRYLVYLSTLHHSRETITEWMYLQLFKIFLEMFGLFCYTAPALPKQTMNINGVDVQSNADLLILHEENLETIAVCKVERCQEESGREEKIKVGNEEQKITNKQEKDRKLREKEAERKQKEKYEQKIKEKMNFLQIETKLVQIDREIKKSLQKDSTDVDKCLAVLEHLNMLPVNQVMLKKNQEILKTLKMLRKFKGSDKVREKAEAIYQKYRNFFLQENETVGSQTSGKEQVNKTPHHPENKQLKCENKENETLQGETNVNESNILVHQTEGISEKVKTESGSISNISSPPQPHFTYNDDVDSENNDKSNEHVINSSIYTSGSDVLESQVEKEIEETCVSPPSKKRCLPCAASDSGHLPKPIGHNLADQTGGESASYTGQSADHNTDNHQGGRVPLPDICQAAQQLNNNIIVGQTNARPASDTGRLVQHLSDNLIGQSGGELLLHYKSSPFKGVGVLGLIVQKTNVTFTRLVTSSQEEIDAIAEGSDVCSQVSVIYSKPYNYLKAEDRLELIKPLLILRSVYLGEQFT